MPPRLPPTLFIRRPSPPNLFAICPRSSRLNFYSTESPNRTDPSTAPLLYVSNIPAKHTGHIRILELNNPKKRNAISLNLLASLRAEIENVRDQYGPNGEEKPLKKRFGGAAGEDEKGPTRALIIASAVKESFCAGADLKERRTFSQDQTMQFLTTLRSTLTMLSDLPIPTISAISGTALGGGLELALSTNFRVLSYNAEVALPETRIGIIPGAGGTHRLPKVIGHARARDLILTGRRVAANEAYIIGLANRLVGLMPEDEREGSDLLELARKGALSEAVNMAQEICEGGPVAIRAALEAVNGASEDKENEMYERVVNTEDRNAALKAFYEKTKPVFVGR